MQPLSDDFLKQCPTEAGFRMRGVAMTRIEVFIDAAFAFAVTMLVISLDEIPRNIDELKEVSKQIPGFILAIAHLIAIWHAHAMWSKKYGLEDTATVVLSAALLIVILIFIYPLKMMFSGLFAWITDSFLPSVINLNNYNDLRHLFFFFAAGFLSICLIFSAMYAVALSQQKPLQLSAYERHDTRTQMKIWFASSGICLLALIAPALVRDHWVPYTSFIYILFAFSSPLIEHMSNKRWQQRNQPGTDSGL